MPVAAGAARVHRRDEFAAALGGGRARLLAWLGGGRRAARAGSALELGPCGVGVAIKDYQKALEILNSTYTKNHKNGDLRRGYIRIIEEIENDAESAFKNNRVAEAGSIYNILLRDSFQTTDFADSVSFDSDFLKKRIKTCARSLTQEGLLKYREGKLDDAISIWKKVLAFDRDNLEVKNAISTAQNQLKNLNTIR